MGNYYKEVHIAQMATLSHPMELLDMKLVFHIPKNRLHQHPD